MNNSFDDYQENVAMVWNGSVDRAMLEHPIIFPTIGLVGESGELANKIKKIFRDKNGIISPDDCEKLVDEMGDILWHMSQICSILNVPFSDVAKRNQRKVADRDTRGVVSGDGDDR